MGAQQIRKLKPMWAKYLGEFDDCFSRSEPAQNLRVYVKEQLSDLPRKSIEEMAFLGPWDADTQKGIYYYRAPMAQAFMGRRAGDTVTLRTETAEEQWEILEVRPAV